LVAELAPVEAAMKEFMVSRDISRGSLAVTRHGRLVLARGFTWDAPNAAPTEPDSLFRIASISKPLTAVAILGLVEEGKLTLEEKVVEVLGLEPPAGQSVDPRLPEVTVRHLLQHLGGWDRSRAYDPMFQDDRIAKELGVSQPISAADILRFMTTEPLQHRPGTTYAYSNFGYCLLGRVVERRSQLGYEEYVRRRVLSPLGMDDTRLGRTSLEVAAPGEVRYEDERRSPYGSFNLENMDAHGGWISSAVDLARFAVAFDRPSSCPVLTEASIETLFGLPENLSVETYRRGEPYYACGWGVRDFGDGERNTWHAGSLPGTYTFLARWRNGVDCVVLLNRRAADAPSIDPTISRAVEAVASWPKHDLFLEAAALGR
jgi:CubicO group peptidase (beta-lactamase class C family)